MTAIEDKIDQLIDLLRAYKRDTKNRAAKATTGDGRSRSKGVDMSPASKFKQIIEIVKRNFAGQQVIPYADIKNKMRDEGAFLPRFDDISMAFCDSKEYCINASANKHELIAYTPENEDKLKRSHQRLIKKYADMKAEEGAIVDQQAIKTPNRPSRRKARLTKTLGEILGAQSTEPTYMQPTTDDPPLPAVPEPVQPVPEQVPAVLESVQPATQQLELPGSNNVNPVDDFNYDLFNNADTDYDTINEWF